MAKIKCKLVIDHWDERMQTPQGVQFTQVSKKEDRDRLTCGNFHSGSTFDAEMEVDLDNGLALACEVMAGFIPVFYVAEVEGVRFNSEVKP